MGGMTQGGAERLGQAEDRGQRGRRSRRASTPGQDVIVGVNKYQLAEEAPIETRDIDNHAVRDSQIARLEGGARRARRAPPCRRRWTR